jgi:hypothetical protein
MADIADRRRRHLFSRVPTPQAFKARIGKIGGLRCVIVPPNVVAALGGGARIPVVARYAGEVTESTLVPAGGSKRRLVLQMGALRPAGLDAGALIEITLTRAEGTHKRPLPPDLQRALQFRPTAAAELDRSSPSTWRMIMESLDRARTPETRQSRIEKIVEHLAQNAADRVRRS